MHNVRLEYDISTDQRPKLKDLNKYVIPHVGPKWEDLGIELELDGDGQLLDEIKRDRRGDEEKCCLDVVKKWLQGAGVGPKTWRKLLECLREIAATNAINTIEANILTGWFPNLIGEGWGGGGGGGMLSAVW